MKQRKFFTKLILLGLIVSIGFVGCKNYDDQIDDLKGQISEVQKTVNDLKAKVDAGSVITKVESTGNGIKITLSDGTTHNITNGATGATGATGAAGAPGSVVTIGSNGNWFIDGKDTGKPSVGAQGPAGPQGPQGPAGIYYIPNADGYWYKVENGVATKTNDKWQLPGIITALWDGKSVTLYGVKDASGNVVDGIVLGLSDLRSIVLKPGFVTPEGFPVIQVGRLTSVCTEIAANLELTYNLNPSNVDENNIDIANIKFNYNGPSVVTRSAQITPTVVANSVSIANGVLKVSLQVDGSKIEASTSSIMDQIQLSVPLKSGGAIVSDWANVFKKDLKVGELAGEVNIGLNKAPYSLLSQTQLAAEGLAANNPLVIEIPENATTDISGYITTILLGTPNSSFNGEPYGLYLNFSKPATSMKGGVNQQTFITKVTEKGEVTAKLLSPIEACPGVEPIIKVDLLSTKHATPCIMETVYVKLSLKHSLLGMSISDNEKIVSYWNTEKTFVKQNIALAGTSVNPAQAIYVNDLKQVFEQDVFTVTLANGAEFFFYAQQPAQSNGIVFTVSADGKTLIYTKAGVDYNVATLGGTDNKDLTLLETAHDDVKELLNKNIANLVSRIGIRAAYCSSGLKDKTVSIDGKEYFDVKFVRPINSIANTPAPFFTDGLNPADPANSISIKKLVNLHDWRYPTTSISAFEPNHLTYYDFYDVQTITIDPATITTNVNVAWKPLSNYPLLEVKVDTTDPNDHKLTYINNGSVVVADFQLKVPVVIEHKWGKLHETVVIDVKKTTGGSPTGVKRK